MAVNRRLADAPKTRRYAVNAARVSGDPVCVGQIPCVLLTDYAARDGKATVQLDGTFLCSVASIDSGGTSGADRNVVGAVGDIVYYDSATTPVLSLRAGGIRFGYLTEAMTSGQTANKLVQVGY